MLAATAAMYGVVASPAFGFRDVRIDGARYSDPAELTRRLALESGANLFVLSTDAVEARLRELTSVATADVGIELPSTVSVRVVEREPILVWGIGSRRLLVDRDGVAFAAATDTTSTTALPAVDDRRSASTALDVGGRLDAIDLDAATRLASIRPADVGSVAPGLSVAVTDENGFVLAVGNGWSAVFGFYTTSLRTPALIPGQVRLLHGLLAGREAQVERVILASDTSGTYVPRATPKPSPTPRP